VSAEQAVRCHPFRRGRLAVLVACGTPADLVVLADPLDDALSAGSPTVLATVSVGTVVHRVHGD
jgi:hypothetical protein